MTQCVKYLPFLFCRILFRNMLTFAPVPPLKDWIFRLKDSVGYEFQVPCTSAQNDGISRHLWITKKNTLNQRYIQVLHLYNFIINVWLNAKYSQQNVDYWDAQSSKDICLFYFFFFLWIWLVRLYSYIPRTKMPQDAKNAQETFNLVKRIGWSR